jgi:outer membrane receptor for ferrienterochelin and colicins
MKHALKCISGIAALLAPMFAAPAFAQSMDYGSLEQLFGEPVTASATGAPLRATEAPANMTIVTADEIRRSGARDIPGVLRHVAGVDVLQWTNDYADVSVRGYNQAYSSRTLVLVDGRQVYADYYGFIPWSALPVELSSIRQIEIVRGPSTGLFSLNAAGGVINIITGNPRYDDVNAVSVRTGSQGMAEVSGVATYRLESVGALRVSGGYRTDGEFASPMVALIPGAHRTENDRAAVDALAVFTPLDGVEVALEASHTHARQNEMLPGFAMQTSRYETNSLKGDLAADTAAGLVKLTAYTNWIDWKGIDVPILGAFVLSNRVTVAQASDTFNPGADHTVRLALEYRHNSVDTAPVKGGTIFYDMVSGSAMWNWRITPELSLTNAVRFDHIMLGRRGSAPDGYPYTNADWNRDKDEFSFNSGLVWTVTQDDTLRLLAGRGVQMPSLVETGALMISMPMTHVTGTPYLDYTAVTDYELVWDRRIPEWNAKVQIGVFHQDTRNLVSISGNYVFYATSYYVTAGNIGSSAANGAELMADGKIGDHWRWSLNYRAEFIHDDLTAVSRMLSNLVDYQHTTPKHLVKVGLGWSDDTWEVDGYLYYQSETTGMQQYGPGVAVKATVDGYVSSDARLAYRLNNWATLAISGQNLLPKSQRQTAGPAVERRLFATLTLND